MSNQKRLANYELLRVLAMVMVVAMHFLDRSDRLPALDEPLDSVRVIGGLLESFCLVAVNTYVFISGYFGVRGTFRPSKAIAFLCQIWFYALLIPLALVAAGVPTVAGAQGAYGLIQYLFPIETEHYWFATSYFMLYLLTPLLNAAVRNMSKKQLQVTLGGLFMLFCGIKSLSPLVFAFDKYGYDLPWFICVYVLAAYFSLYGSAFLERKGWFIYVGSCLLSFGIILAMWFLSRRWDSFGYYFTVPFHYNFIFCLTGAVGLFYGFSGIAIREGCAAQVVRKLGGLSFGIYLFHEHIDLRSLWYGCIRQAVNPGGRGGFPGLLWELFCCVVILFMAGIVIDWLRSRLFLLASIQIRKTRLGLAFGKLDGYFK